MTHPFMKIKLIASAFALIGGTSIVYADGIIFIDQFRGVSAGAEVVDLSSGKSDEKSDIDVAPDFGLFGRMVSVAAVVPTA